MDIRRLRKLAGLLNENHFDPDTDREIEAALRNLSNPLTAQQKQIAYDALGILQEFNGQAISVSKWMAAVLAMHHDIDAHDVGPIFEILMKRLYGICLDEPSRGMVKWMTGGEEHPLTGAANMQLDLSDELLTKAKSSGVFTKGSLARLVIGKGMPREVADQIVDNFLNAYRGDIKSIGDGAYEFIHRFDNQGGAMETLRRAAADAARRGQVDKPVQGED